MSTFQQRYTSAINAINAGRVSEGIATLSELHQADPNHVPTVAALGQVKLLCGQQIEALAWFKSACLKSNNPRLQRLFVAAIRGVRFGEGGLGDQDMEQLLCACLNDSWDRVDDVAGPAISLLKHRRSWLANPLPLEEMIQDVLPLLEGDELLHALLRSTPVTDTQLEFLLTNIRRFLLSQSASIQTDPSPQALRFISSLAVQCHLNDFAWHADADEIVKAGELLSQPNSTAHLYHYFLAACFSSPAERNAPPPWVDQLIPAHCVHALQLIWVNPRGEACLRTSVRSLTEISGEISLAVQAQYEESPFPRWQPTQQHRLARALSSHESTSLTRILVAGCGTGQHAVDVAIQHPQAQVIAIDLSRRSLAYALREATTLGIHNLSFGHADLIELRFAEASFDHIECCGVLHHLREPEVGLRNLTSMLKQQGTFRIALYSRIARSAINAMRAIIKERGFGDSPSEIRRFRHFCMAHSSIEPFQQIIEFRDFFSTSMCRDLLFHRMEHQFDIAGIRELLDSADLRFQSFDLSPSQRNAFLSHYGNSRKLDDLDAWGELEPLVPYLFRSMYQFLVVKQ